MPRLCESCQKNMSKKKWEFLTKSPTGLVFRWFPCSFVCALSILSRQANEYKHTFERKGDV